MRLFVREEQFLEALWRDVFVQGVELTEKEEALLAGLLFESAGEIDSIVAKVGGWHGFGPFLRRFGMDRGLLRPDGG